VDDAAPRRHPLRAAGADRRPVAHVVLVLESALQHDRQRLDAAMRVRREARHELVAILGADLVEHQERVEVMLRPADDAPDLHPRAIGGRVAGQDLADALVAHGSFSSSSRGPRAMWFRHGAMISMGRLYIRQGRRKTAKYR
jgi:hypothetical protein